MTKDEIRAIVEADNGKGFANNINLNGYTFIRGNSFMIFEFKVVDGVKLCHIKYIHYESEKELTSLFTYACNFWMGNDIQFIFYREKDRQSNSPVAFMRELNFREDIIRGYRWKWKFQCENCKKETCDCVVHCLYK